MRKLDPPAHGLAILERVIHLDANDRFWCTEGLTSFLGQLSQVVSIGPEPDRAGALSMLWKIAVKVSEKLRYNDSKHLSVLDQLTCFVEPVLSSITTNRSPPANLEQQLGRANLHGKLEARCLSQTFKICC